MGLHNIKKLLYRKKKKTDTRLKRHPIEWEKIFAKCTSDKGLLTRICRELKNPNSQRINDSMKKWKNELN
jgi:predicted acetyltransferase